MTNVRYVTATHIGTWAQDKVGRFSLLPQNDEPISGTSAWRLTITGLSATALAERRALPRRAFRRSAAPCLRRWAREADVAEEDHARAGAARPSQGAGRRRYGRVAVLFALQREGITVVDGQELMSTARGDQDAGRDLAAQHVGRYGRCRVLRSLQGDAAGHAGERRRRHCRQNGFDLGPSTSRRSMPFRANAATRIRTCSRIASCGRVIRCTTTSSTPAWDTARAITDASRSAWRPRADRCVQTVPGLPRRLDRAVKPGRTTAESGVGLAEGAGIRLTGRGSRLCAAVGHGIGLGVWEKPMISRLVSFEHSTRSNRGRCSRSRPSGHRPTVGAPRASRRKSSSPRPATR